MASTSTLLVATSNLVNGTGLAPNASSSTLCNTIKSDSLVSAYASVQPGTTNGNVLQSNGLSVATLGLPLFVSNANTVVSNITTQSTTVFPDVVTFSSILLSLDSYILNASKTYKSISGFSDTAFDDLGINVDSHQGAVTNGIASLFGGGATDPATIKANINTLADAIENLGFAYDIKDLANLGTPASFIKNLITLGFGSTSYATDTGFITVAGFQLPSTWKKTSSSVELNQFLEMITGPMLEKIISQTAMVLPYPDSVSSAAQLLDLNMVFPPEAVALVPGNNFAGLANMFVNLGGEFETFSDVATMLRGIEVPTLNYLGSYTAPVTSSDVTTLTSKIGTGNGDNGNPTIMDVLGSVAGVHIDNLNTVANALSSISSRSNTTTLTSSLTALAAACAGGVPATISSSFATVQTAATAFKNDPVVTTLTSANTAISSMETQVAKEIKNISLSGLNIAAAPTSGVAGVLALANNLHDYGVDRDNLAYGKLFAGLAQSNTGGDAIKASLAEGKNLDIQTRYGVQIGTKLA